VSPEKTLTTGQWGMVAFLMSEVAFFSTLIVAYLTYLGRDTVGPTPAEALRLGLVVFTTACLLSSSVTVHLAERSLRADRRAPFSLWWSLTIALGAIFLLGTAYEWNDLITRKHLTIDRNLFGTTYYTLVGFHALHVTAGVVALLVVLALALRRQVNAHNAAGAGLVAWYWHFVDGVWVVVFTVVYLIGR
jgi:cytochrome c oxidase subunit 3/cytochrome o ubiquinol oxidase subunit 3